MPTDPAELVGVAEIAKMAGVSRSAVANWRARLSDFPQPVAELQAGPVFLRLEVWKWLQRSKKGKTWYAKSTPWKKEMKNMAESVAEMTIFEALRQAGEELQRDSARPISCQDLKECAARLCRRKLSSIIPSDYCYNLENEAHRTRGINKNKRLFLYVSRALYFYVGEHFEWVGQIAAAPMMADTAAGGGTGASSS